MIEETIAEFRACRSPTDLYRCQIRFEQQASPLDFAALRDRASLLPEKTQQWIIQVAALMFRENQRVQSFRRQPIADLVTLYAGERAAVADKELIIGFTGHSRRLGLPACAVLQYFQDDRHDVIVLQETLPSFFLTGITGYARSMPELIRRLLLDFDPARYRQVRVIGVSGGGAAAIRAAVALEAVRAVAVNPVVPNLSNRAVTPVARSALPELLTAWKGVDSRKTTLVCAYSEGNEEDAAHAKQIAGDGPVSLLPYPGTDHNLIFDLLKRSQLRRFFDEVVLA